jgi:hypothetical protein
MPPPAWVSSVMAAVDVEVPPPDHWLARSEYETMAGLFTVMISVPAELIGT